MFVCDNAVLYPRDCEVVGHCRGEAVYSRKNVHVVSHYM